MTRSGLCGTKEMRNASDNNRDSKGKEEKKPEDHADAWSDDAENPGNKECV